MPPNPVLLKPIITEKTMRLVNYHQYTFLVHPQARKHQIAQAVTSQFKVDVLKVSTSKNKGKLKRFGRKRLPVALSDTKKAIVQLKKGQKISLFDIQEEKKSKK